MSSRQRSLTGILRWAAAGIVLAAVTGVPSASHSAAAARTPATARPTTAPPAKAPEAVTKSAAPATGKRDMTLKGGEEGTVFRTLTVEGEDRIHIEVERPALKLDLDPEQAPGLDWGSARDVLDRTTPDLSAPLMTMSAREPSPFVARPWLGRFSDEPVARFRPEVRNVQTWKLIVVDARGEAVASFTGKGEPPREIAWNGRTTTGGAVRPGVTYSYVFEARDQAGNKRNFVGEGFRVSAFRVEGAGGPELVFAGRELPAVSRSSASESPAPPIMLEAATALNQSPASSRPVQVEVTARSFEEANAIATRLTRWLAPLVIGDPARLQAVARVQPDAPEGGAVRIAATR